VDMGCNPGPLFQSQNFGIELAESQHPWITPGTKIGDTKCGANIMGFMAMALGSRPSSCQWHFARSGILDSTLTDVQILECTYFKNVYKLQQGNCR